MKRTTFRRAWVFVALGAAFVAACGWDPTRPFDRESPQVNEALRYYDAGEAGAAAELLQDYLTTGPCQEGNIGTPSRLRERPNGAFDLGLALFKIAEAYGHRFGEEENDAGFLDPNLKGMRAGQVECALRIVRAVAEDPSQPVPLRARARYLEGNLLFLVADYEEAVKAYDKALELAPGMGDAGPIGANLDAGVTYAPDPIGRDAAWNRAIALRRIEDKKDAGQDAAPNDGGGAGGGGDQNQNDDGDRQNDAGGDDDQKDAGGGDGDDDQKDAGGNEDAGDDSNENDEPENDAQDAGPPPPPPPSRQSQDERILDQLENAPTVQQEAAKRHARTRQVRGMVDK